MLKLIFKNKNIGNVWDYDGIKISHCKENNKYYAVKFEGLKPFVSINYNSINEIIQQIDNNTIAWKTKEDAIIY
jgi:hypothetical protein